MHGRTAHFALVIAKIYKMLTKTRFLTVNGKSRKLLRVAVCCTKLFRFVWVSVSAFYCRRVIHYSSVIYVERVIYFAICLAANKALHFNGKETQLFRQLLKK